MRFLKQTGIVLLSALAGFVYWQWASQPLWSIERDIVRYHCHDISRQEVVLHVRHQGEHCLETRQLRTGVLLNQEKLPYLDIRKLVHPNALAEHREDALVIFSQLINSDNGNIMLVDVYQRGTGKKINPLTLESHSDRHHEAYGNKAAICTKQGLLLYETNKSEPRFIAIENAISINFLHEAKFMVCLTDSQIHVIEWSSGKILYSEACPSDVRHKIYIHIMPSSDIIINREEANHETSIERKRWDGRQLVVRTRKYYFVRPPPGYLNVMGQMQYEDDAGRLHTALYVAFSIPAPWRDLLPWIKAKTGLSFEKYFEQRRLYVWFVLGRDNTIQQRYEDDANKIHSLHGASHLLVKTRYSKDAKLQTTFVISTIPAWPNALAISLTVYLLLYVYRHRRHRV